jgi:hypothetical protein
MVDSFYFENYREASMLFYERMEVVRGMVFFHRSFGAIPVKGMGTKSFSFSRFLSIIERPRAS